MQIEADIAAELRRGPDGVVWQVRDLAHLDRIHKTSGGRLVVILAYSRSCGSCKRALEMLQHMSRQVCEFPPGRTYTTLYSVKLCICTSRWCFIL